MCKVQVQSRVRQWYAIACHRVPSRAIARMHMGGPGIVFGRMPFGVDEVVFERALRSSGAAHRFKAIAYHCWGVIAIPNGDGTGGWGGYTKTS